MRVIAGTAKGRRLAVPPGDDVRPTGDRVREALFSSLQPHLRNAIVLDLFAGSGALGIEALSRGAAHATFVERDPAIAALVRQNTVAAGVDDRCEVVTSRALAFLRRSSTATWTLAFLDPPYALDEPELAGILEALRVHLAEGAQVVVERDRRSPAPAWPPGMEASGDRAYGSTRLHRAVAVPTK